MTTYLNPKLYVGIAADDILDLTDVSDLAISGTDCLLRRTGADSQLLGSFTSRAEALAFSQGVASAISLFAGACPEIVEL